MLAFAQIIKTYELWVMMPFLKPASRLRGLHPPKLANKCPILQWGTSAETSLKPFGRSVVHFLLLDY